ncbi:MAG TPA: hypothetical protein PKN75_12030 [Bacteroidia bacterium]|nr:hypothetical protein [Bacteroidia bacterium]HNU34305.1 hypothetical protein [Bacteroidia bacterium]
MNRSLFAAMLFDLVVQFVRSVKIAHNEEGINEVKNNWGLNHNCSGKKMRTNG